MNADRQVRFDAETSDAHDANAVVSTDGQSMKPVPDASHLYDVERRARHAERPGFRISELQLGPTQCVPWHYHTVVADTFYVLEGTVRINVRDPDEDILLGPGESTTVLAKRPHRVTNAGTSSAAFLVLQGIGEYDYVPLDETSPSGARDAEAPRRTEPCAMYAVVHSFAYCLDYLREQVADVAESDMVVQPNGIMNHPAWVVGHLTHACQLLGGAIGLPGWLPGDWASRYGTGSVPVADVGRYESKATALAMLDDAQDRIMRAVSSLEPARLDEPFPVEEYRHVFPTIRHALTQVLVGHTANHVGQVSVWRKAMGFPPMGRPFE